MQLKDNTIGSVIGALKTEGIKASDIAKTINGISEKPLRRALKEAGYAFQNKAPKGWQYVGEGKEPLHKSIFDYVKPSVKSSSHGVHTEVTKSEGETEFTRSNTNVVATTSEILPISHVVHPQFTRNEVEDLVAMLQEWRINKQAEQQGIAVEETNFHERIKALPVNDKTRKTIVIDKGIATRLDDFCAVEKVNKSDIMHLALLDFLKKYEKE